MSFKREFDSQSATDEEAAAKPPKKQRMHDGASNGKGKHHSSAPTTDLTYGQRYVFSSLDEPTVPYGEDLEFEDEQDALAYLKAVRQEAGGIPHLLVAAKAGPQLPPRPGPDELCYDEEDVDRALYDTGLGDTRGYYFDGTYTAAPGPESEDGLLSEGEAGDEKRIYEAYYSSIIHRFNQLRDLLHQDPPASALSALSSEHATNVGPSAPRSQSFLVWRGRLLRTDPLPAQVAAMDKESILWLLRVILNGKLMQRGSHLRERTSRWLWALLARLPDRGELDHTDVGWVRELGKRAVLMMTSIAQMAALREQVELDEGGRDDDEDGLDDDPVKQERDEDEAEIKGEADGDAEEIETCSVGSAPMEDSASEGGEVLVGPAPVTQDAEADIEAAKARLLARLDAVEDTPPEPGFVPVTEPEIPTPAPPSQPSTHEVGGGGDDVPFDAARARINMRATLNMILTVAGEFYGQRDLLEFRDPFPGL